MRSSESSVEGRAGNIFDENGVEILKQLFTSCARPNFGRVVDLSGFIYRVCYFLFNGVVELFVDGKLRFDPSSLRRLSAYRRFPFQLRELFRDTADPGRRLPCADWATVERGMLVKDRTEMVIL